MSLVPSLSKKQIKALEQAAYHYEKHYKSTSWKKKDHLNTTARNEHRVKVCSAVVKSVHSSDCGSLPPAMNEIFMAKCAQLVEARPTKCPINICVPCIGEGSGRNCDSCKTYNLQFHIMTERVLLNEITHSSDTVTKKST
jgi:hypothetical protein